MAFLQEINIFWSIIGLQDEIWEYNNVISWELLLV